MALTMSGGHDNASVVGSSLILKFFLLTPVWTYLLASWVLEPRISCLKRLSEVPARPARPPPAEPGHPHPKCHQTAQSPVRRHNAALTRTRRRCCAAKLSSGAWRTTCPRKTSSGCAHVSNTTLSSANKVPLPAPAPAHPPARCAPALTRPRPHPRSRVQGDQRFLPRVQPRGQPTRTPAWSRRWVCLVSAPNLSPAAVEPGRASRSCGATSASSVSWCAARPPPPVLTGHVSSLLPY